MRFTLWKVVVDLMKILLDFERLLITNIEFDGDAFDKTH